MHKIKNLLSWVRRQPRWRLVAAVVALGLVGWFAWSGSHRAAGKNPLFTARRGPLEINILEGGSLSALESQEVKCEVRVGYQGTKILKIVEEGYLVTDEDVKTNKVLVELDSSDLQKQIVQQEIQYQSAVATLIDAQQGYEIQLNQNQSDIQAAEQKVRFARMDFDKFLGDTAAAKVIEKVGLDTLLAAASTNNVEETVRAEAATSTKPGPKPPEAAPPPPRAAPPGAGPRTVTVTTGDGALLAVTPPAAVPAPATPPPAPPKDEPPDSPSLAATNTITVDFSEYAKLEALGDGEAKQKVRKFEDDLQVAQKELGQAQTTIEGTRRLYEKGFVTKTDLERDEIAFENNRLKVQTAATAQDLFLKYDFVKSAEEALSKYADSVRELDKARRLAISKAAQAKARLKSAQGQYEVQLRQRNDLNEQADKCIIHAKKPGLVVYGGARDDMFFYSGEERIREGATVRERQAIITIPDMTRMAVNVRIHESYIKKVKKGQKARITVDAFPDKILTGEITKVGVLPDSQNRWMNPDMKVYLTTITVDGTQDWVKPGMSAKVEILVNKIADCVYVPMQAVSPAGDKQVCFVSRGLRLERREVEIGEFNDEFIEIKKGLKEGEQVSLQAPEASEPATPDSETQPAPGTKPGQERKSAPVTPAAAPAAPPVQARKA